ncbi:LuxR C-terminal-related transcriptional regulator [Kitasatospora sp. NPDC048722]|uniref:LuxR C-terminal-related transcriptional regulator n=1 Tax=Kitasatospora sp. NPDC048722 TaxID=3155639 RepID=UPI0033F4EB8B
MQPLEAPDPPGPPQSRRVAPSGDPVLAARFTVPGAPKILVRRPELLNRLTAGVRAPLSLVNGPAGAGKTTLVAGWIHDGLAPHPTVWLTVEPGDAPGTFWAYLLEAFHHHGEPLAAGVGRPTRAEGIDSSLLVRLAHELAERPDPVVLVLDQFDLADDPEITDGLHFVLRHAAQGLRLVLTSRTDPLFPLHRYRAAGDITEIRNADLKLGPAEAAVLLREHGLDLSDAGIRLLADRTDGWAAGLRLCAVAMQRSADPEAFVRDFAAHRSTIADYLLTEALETQPPPVQDLLLRASISDHVHPALADTLTGRDDGAWTLARLARANAFLEPIDESGWYRLHPLFAEVLRAHLRHRCPGLEPELRARAARWLAGTGRLTEAVTQAATSGDWHFAADRLIDDLAIGRLFTGLDTVRLRRALAPVPPDLTGAAPALVDAACRLTDQDLAGCAAALRRADEHLAVGRATDQRPTDAAGPAARLTRAFLGVLAGRLTGDLAATRRSATDTERLFGEVPAPLIAKHPEIRAMVLAALGAAELDAGNLDRARSGLAAAIAASGHPGTEHPRCDALASLALVDLWQGRLRSAEEHALASLALAEQSALPARHRSGLDHLVLADVAVEHDDLAGARAHLELADVNGEVRAEPLTVVEAAVIGARLATAAGDWEGALATIHALPPIAGRRHLPPWTTDRLAIAESHAHLAHGDAGAALAVLDATASDRPERTVARARALLAAGQPDRVTELLDGLPADGRVPAPSRTQACLLLAQAATAKGSTEEARALLRTALLLARPDELRRAFVECGSWVHRLLRQDPQLARAHDWLPSQVRGSGHVQGAPGRTPVVEPLSEREITVLRQAARMLSTEEIATELYVSANTVKTHLRNIYRKLCVTRRSEAVHRAQDLGML